MNWNREKLVSFSEDFLKGTEQYKELEGQGEENYEVTCILLKGSPENPEDVIAYAERADQYLMLYLTDGFVDSSQGFHFDSEVFCPLEKGYDIIFMTPERHFDMWTMLGEFEDEKVSYKQGFRKYMEYCKGNGITKNYMQKELSYWGESLESLYRQKVKRADIGKDAR